LVILIPHLFIILEVPEVCKHLSCFSDTGFIFSEKDNDASGHGRQIRLFYAAPSGGYSELDKN